MLLVGGDNVHISLVPPICKLISIIIATGLHILPTGPLAGQHVDRPREGAASGASLGVSQRQRTDGSSPGGKEQVRFVALSFCAAQLIGLPAVLSERHVLQALQWAESQSSLRSAQEHGPSIVVI